MKKLFPVALLMVAVLVGGVACAAAAPKLALPQGYIKASDVVPAMGEHWLNPENPTAPVYLIYEREVHIYFITQAEKAAITP